MDLVKFTKERVAQIQNNLKKHVTAFAHSHPFSLQSFSYLTLNCLNKLCRNT